MRLASGRHLAALLALAALVVLGGAPEAKAGFQVTLTVGATSFTIVDDDDRDLDLALEGVRTTNRIVINEVVNGYRFNVTLSTTNTPGIPTLSFVDVGSNGVEDLGADQPNTTVSIYASANGFTSPTAPPPLTALTSGTIQFTGSTPDGNSANPVSIRSFIDTTNALTTSAAGSEIGSASGGPLQAGTANDNVDLNDMRVITTLNSPYTINLELTAMLIQAGSNIDLDGSVRLSPVPEPSTLAAAIVGLPLLGGFWLIRRRKAA